MIYTLLKNKITRGTYDREDLKNKMDTYLLFGRITEEQYAELTGLMARLRYMKKQRKASILWGWGHCSRPLVL